MIPAQDLDRPVEFYRDAPGFKFLFQVPGRGMAFFGRDGVRLCIGEPEAGQEFSNGAPIYYRVESVDNVYSDLKEKNVDLAFEPHMIYEDETHELWMIFINDTEGNPVGFMEERPKN